MKGMMGWGCKCVHHWLTSVLSVLIWVSAVAYFWVEWRMEMVWGFDSMYYFQTAILMALLVFSTKFCRCCNWHGRMMGDKMGGEKMDAGMCKDVAGCRCGNCRRCC